MDENNLKEEAIDVDAAPEGGQKNTKQPKAKKPKAPRILAFVCLAAVVIAVLALALTNLLTKNKVTKAFETYVQVFVTGEKAADGIKWRKYYPKEIEDDVEAWAKERAERIAFREYDYKILSVTKLDGDDNDKLVVDLVEHFYETHDFSIKTRDLIITDAYLMLVREDSKGVPVLTYVFVAKVNGNYGVYSMVEAAFE